jgi:excinuclease ABC subunit C
MIKKLLSNITTKPGIYQMLDSKNNIIYIGKALNLKKRVTSYFSKNINNIKTNKLIENVDNIKVIITKNEEEALILENTLIKKFKPKYNILLRDDKSYPYIYIDSSHQYPLIKFYRGLKTDKKGYYFGPYTQVNTVRHMLNLIQKIFKVRSCENTYFLNRKKPCLQYQINRCDAPCVKLISQKEYKESIHNSILFLQGKNKSLIKEFTNKMELLSNKKKYEEALIFRDKISMIRNITKPKDVIENQIELDVITISERNNYACIDVFMVREGINLGNKSFEFKNINMKNPLYLLNAFIKQYYLTNTPTSKIIIPDKLQDSSILSNFLSKKYKKKLKLIPATRKPYSSWLKICQTNTDNRLDVLLSTKNKNHIFYSLNQDLKFKQNINNIICFDVSHLSGSNMKGSSVWFSDNGPQKNLYRRYNLDQINKYDDYEAMRYIIHKRLSGLIEENNLPTLILVDGGKGQITQANKAVKDLNIKKINILGIVKGHKRASDNDKILNYNFIDITTKLSSHSMATLQRIRDEAHRFAIIAQRKSHQRKQLQSKLDYVPGIGKKRKIELLKYFGGIQGVMKSSLEELSKVPGINERLADVIYNYLQNK